MLNPRSLAALFTLSIFMFIPSAVRAEDPVKIVAGGSASHKMLLEKKAELQQAAGGPVEITVSPNTSSIVPFVKGLVDGIAVGTSLEQGLALAEKAGLPKQKAADYQIVDIIRIVMLAAVHPSNPVKALSHDQLAGILNGKITTWEPITGEKEPIKVFIARNYVFASKALADTFTGGQPSKFATFVGDKDGVLRAMQSNPHSIGFFAEKEKAGNFEPKFFETDATFGSSLVMKKTARPAAQKVFDYFKTHKP